MMADTNDADNLAVDPVQHNMFAHRQLSIVPLATGNDRTDFGIVEQHRDFQADVPQVTVGLFPAPFALGVVPDLA